MSTTTSVLKRRTMPYVRLGQSGMKISKIVLGMMSYGDKGYDSWLIDDEQEVIKHVKTAYEAGINAFDTANVYSNGLSEVLLGKAIKELNLPRDEIVVMTKLYGVVGRTYNSGMLANVFDPEGNGFVNQHGLSRKHIFESVKHSLERLQLDYIDLLQCHRFDEETPVEETMQALHDIVKAGYVRYIGMSSCDAWQFHVMQNYAISRNLTPFISMQNHYNIVYREEEREMMPTLKHFGVGAIPWSPLARGLVTRPLEATGKTARGSKDFMINAYAAAAGTAEIVKRIEEIAKKKGASMAQISAAWVMHKDPVAAPIVGTTSLKNLVDIIGAVHINLTAEEMAYLEEPYKPQDILGHGHAMMASLTK